MAGSDDIAVTQSPRVGPCSLEGKVLPLQVRRWGDPKLFPLIPFSTNEGDGCQPVFQMRKCQKIYFLQKGANQIENIISGSWHRVIIYGRITNHKVSHAGSRG